MRDWHPTRIWAVDELEVGGVANISDEVVESLKAGRHLDRVKS